MIHRTPVRPLFGSAVCAAMLIALLAGCSSAKPPATDSRLTAAVRPKAPDLTTPETATRAYLDWVTFAYRTTVSDVASPTLTPYEGVRIDSYIQLNREKGQGIDQRLTAFSRERLTIEGTSAVLAASETWEYRYFLLKDASYTGPEHTTSYDTTYTLLKGPSGWQVDKVEATVRGPVE